MRYKFDKIKNNRKIAYKNLIDFLSIFKKKKIKVFLLYGTLLGLYRDKTLISGDNDIDLGCFAENFVVNKKKILKLLRSNGFLLVRENKSLIQFIRFNENLDLYLFHKLPFAIGRFSMNFFIKNIFLKNLEIMVIGKNKFFVPSNTKLFLKTCYGESWKKPIKNKTAKTNLIFNIFYFILPKKIIQFIGQLITKY